jgi:hypothetical protein
MPSFEQVSWTNNSSLPLPTQALHTIPLCSVTHFQSPRHKRGAVSSEFRADIPSARKDPLSLASQH